MLYLKDFDTHASYEASFNDDTNIIIPSVSYCDDANDVHYMRYNFVRFYVGNMEGIDSTTVTINTLNSDTQNRIDVNVNKEDTNKWHTYVLPKGNTLDNIYCYYDIIKKVIVKGDIHTTSTHIIPYLTVEASFKGSKMLSHMSNMFDGCSGLTSLDLSNFDTSYVGRMERVFANCSGLTSLDLSSFDTSNVDNMNHMFSNCTKLTSLTLSNFNTSKVNNMEYMFNHCENFTALSLSNFNTSEVTDMNHMFTFCSKLTSLDLKGFNVSRVYSMSSMFNSCSSLDTLDISGWDMSNVARTDIMFTGCSSLKTIKMIGCNTTTVTKIKDQLADDNITGVTITTK